MQNIYDVIVIGGGPAGLTAAIYLARAKYRTLVLEKDTFGGQITITHEVVNYPGVARTDGTALTQTMRDQARAFGAEFLLAEAESLDLSGDLKTVRTARGELKAFAVLLATGAHPRMVGFRGESEFRGRGVAYCATCDGEFFTGKEVFVIGGGFAAAEEAVFLTRYARHVTVLVREEDFSCAASVAEAAKNHPDITVLYNVEVEAVSGNAAVDTLHWRSKTDGRTHSFHAPEGIGVFVFAGYVPATGLIRDLAELDSRGYVLSDANGKTSAEGLWAAGEVRVKELRQVVTAVADGALAAAAMEKYCARLQAKTGLQPRLPQPETATQAPEAAASPARQEGGLFDADMLAQLNAVFSRMASDLILELTLDDRSVSRELEGYMEALAALTDRLTLRRGGSEAHAPCVRVLRSDGSFTGLAFHGVPGGHEFTSFVLGLYNAAGPGQPLDAELRGEIAALPGHDLTVLVSLNCTMCPELVTAAQRLAAENPGITARVYDLNHFPGLKEQYSVMSVPCLVVDGGKTVAFGRKNLRQLTQLLK